MGQKSEKEDREEDFETKAKKMEFEAPRRWPAVKKKCLIAALTSWSTISKGEEKNALVKSSGPGALLFLRKNTASRISRSSRTFAKSRFELQKPLAWWCWKGGQSKLGGEPWIDLKRTQQPWIWLIQNLQEWCPHVGFYRFYWKILSSSPKKWKKRAFLSSSWSHFILDFCFQWISSAIVKWGFYRV